MYAGDRFYRLRSWTARRGATGARPSEIRGVPEYLASWSPRALYRRAARARTWRAFYCVAVKIGD